MKADAAGLEEAEVACTLDRVAARRDIELVIDGDRL
jgi:hypothetical protein